MNQNAPRLLTCFSFRGCYSISPFLAVIDKRLCFVAGLGHGTCVHGSTTMIVSTGVDDRDICNNQVVQEHSESITLDCTALWTPVGMRWCLCENTCGFRKKPTSCSVFACFREASASSSFKCHQHLPSTSVASEVFHRPGSFMAFNATAHIYCRHSVQAHTQPTAQCSWSIQTQVPVCSVLNGGLCLFPK